MENTLTITNLRCKRMRVIIKYKQLFQNAIQYKGLVANFMNNKTGGPVHILEVKNIEN